MTKFDDYFTNEDKLFSENMNDALLFSNAFGVSVSVEMPKMFNDGSFANNTTPRKCGVAIVALRTQLPSGISINNDGELTGTGTVQLRFYPNFNNFNYINSVSWDDTEDIIINLKKPNGAIIASDINNGVINSESEELKRLQEIIFEIQLNNATLSDFTVTMQGKQGDRYGADVKIDTVDGLDTRLSNIQDKNDTQNSRLDDIESTNTSQNSRLTTVENNLGLIRNYKITASTYNPKIDTNITVSVQVTDKANNIIPYANVTLLRTSKKTSTTHTTQANENGVATFTILMNQWGINDFQVGNEHCNVYVDGWRRLAGNLSTGKWAIFRNKTKGKVVMNGVAISTVLYSWKAFASESFNAKTIRPTHIFTHPAQYGDVHLRVDSAGVISYKSDDSCGVLHNVTIYTQFEWEIRDSDQ